MPRNGLWTTFAVSAFLTSFGCQSVDYPMLQSWSDWKSTRDDSIELRDPERLHVAAAKVNEQSGKFDKARSSYETAAEANPKSVEAILGLARLDLLGGRYHAAEQGFLKALEFDRTNPLVVESLGRFYLTQRRFREAAQHLSRGVELTPGNARMRHRLAVALAQQGEIAAAESHFIQAVGEAEADYNIGVIQYQNGDIDEAEKRFLNAVLKKPTLANAQKYLDAVRSDRQARGLIAQANPVQQGFEALPPPGQDAAGRRGERHAPTQSSSTSHQPLNPVIDPNASLRQVAGPPTAPQPRLDPADMNATQLEQYENSMTAQELDQFRLSLKNGTSIER